MHKEILTEEQIALLPLVKSFSKNFGLVGGTAIALHIGHRRSIDFDLFSEKEFGNLLLQRKIEKEWKIDEVIINKKGEFTFVMNAVKFTFFHYPFAIPYTESFDYIIKLPSLAVLSAMKAFALGQRAKWKDYVDLYFVMKNFLSFQEIVLKSKELFGTKFNEKLFRIQLSYFNDINYEEKVEFLPGFEVSEDVVKKQLVEFSLK